MGGGGVCLQKFLQVVEETVQAVFLLLGDLKRS